MTEPILEGSDIQLSLLIVEANQRSDVTENIDPTQMWWWNIDMKWQ